MVQLNLPRSGLLEPKNSADAKSRTIKLRLLARPTAPVSTAISQERGKHASNHLST